MYCIVFCVCCCRCHFITTITRVTRISLTRKRSFFHSFFCSFFPFFMCVSVCVCAAVVHNCWDAQAHTKIKYGYPFPSPLSVNLILYGCIYISFSILPRHLQQKNGFCAKRKWFLVRGRMKKRTNGVYVSVWERERDKKKQFYLAKSFGWAATVMATCRQWIWTLVPFDSCHKHN